MSWGGRGRDDETRERMIDAARRSGMSVSELVRALAEESPTAEERGRAERRRPAEPEPDPYDRYEHGEARRDRRADEAHRPARAAGDIDRQLDALAERLRNLAGGETAPAAATPRPRRKVPERTAERAPERTAERATERASERMPERRPEPAEPVEDTTLDEIAATVERLSRQFPDPAPKKPAKARPQTDVATILAALDGLDQRVKALAEERGRPAAKLRPERAAAEAADRAVAEERPRAAAKARPERGVLDDLDRAIAEISQRQSALDRDRRPRRAAAGAGPDIEKHFRDLSEKIEQLRAREERNSPATLVEEIRDLRQLVEQRARGGVDIGEEIRRLATRIDDLATRHPERTTLEPLMTEMGRLRDAVLQSDVEGSLKSLEAGYGHIVDRLDDLKRGLAGPRVGAKVDAEISEIRNLLRAVPQMSQLSAIEQSLHDLAGKVERLTAVEEDPSVERLERRIADLKAQIERIDPAPVVKALDQRLKLVGDKLDAIEKAARGPVTGERIVGLLDELRTTAAASGTREELRALDERLAELSTRIADLDRRRPSYDDTDRLADRIAEIAGKLDRMAVPVTDRRTVDALEATISRLDDLLARQSAPSDAIDPNIAALIERLDRGVGPSNADIDALGREIAEMRRELSQSRSIGDLETQMRTLAERLERASAADSDDESLTQIEEQLAAISRHLETTESRFGGLPDIEDAIHRLGDRIETNQTDAIRAAREAAREMVRELGDTRAEPIAEGVLRVLQDDLKALKSAARDSESRTNDTLISLHDALTGIVGRLTAIEKIAQGSARAASARSAAAEAAAAATPAVAAAAPAPSRAAVASQTSTPAAPAPAAAPAAARPSAPMQPAPGGGVASAIARAREALAATASEDTRPLEPGSGKPTPRPTVVTPPTATMTPTTVDTTPRAEPKVNEAASARKADFIAAARRAAQAAAAGAELPLAATAADRAAAPQTEGGEDAGSGALARIGQVLKSRRRPLVLATGAVLLAVLSLRLLPGGGDQPHFPEAASAPEATAAQTDAAAPRARPIAAGEKAPAAETTAAAHPTAATPSVAEPADAPVSGAAPAPAAEAPRAAEPSVATPPATAPTAANPLLSDQPARRTSALTRPAPDAALLGAPATTGSIAPKDATPTPSAPASDTATLPAAIGSDRLRTAAEAGDPKAAFEIGMRFAEGRGVSPDPKAAAEWYARAADKGLVPAKYRLAVAFEKGIGVARDADRAKSLYRSAAEAGNVRAMHNLGVLHANARDIAGALPWFQKAADLGLKDSQFNLGIIYALGSGVKQDLAVSYKWFSLAARQGDKEADKKQADVAAHLGKVDLAAARMAVQTWVQKPMNRDANEELEAWSEPKGSAQVAALDDADSVARVQSLLKSRGIYGGAVDGQMGPQTRAAIRTFQKKVGRPQSGAIDGDLLQVLAGKTY